MTKQEILEHFKDINQAYNESTRLDDLSHMLDELILSPNKTYVDQYCDEEKLNYIRKYIVENIMRNSDIMHNDDARNYVDLPEVIASLYELLHLIVTGESYEYMFHWANKCGSWVEDDLFTEQYERRDNHEQ